MEDRHLEKAQHVMTTAVLPDTTRKTLQAALKDAALRGFHIDIEQLRSNLRRLGPGRAGSELGGPSVGGSRVAALH